MSQQQNTDLQAELNALRQRLCELESKCSDLEGRASHAWRPRWARKFLLVVLPVALLVSGGLLYAQSDALFIDNDGNATFWSKVGIGKKPSTDLDVKGSAAFGAGLDVKGNAALGAGLDVKGKVALGAGLDVKGNAAFGAGLDVKGKAAFGEELAIASTASQYQLLLRGPGAGGVSSARIEVTEKSHPGRGTDLVIQTYAGNVGIGTSKPPEAKLDVNGSVKVRGAVAASEIRPAWVSGYIPVDNSKDQKKAQRHGLGRIPTQIMLYFTPTQTDGRWYPVSLSRLEATPGNPVTTEVTKDEIILNIYHGNSVFEIWDAKTNGWQKHNKGYWVVMLY